MSKGLRVSVVIKDNSSVKDPASALGEAVGKLVEEAVKKVVEELARKYKLTVHAKQKISDKAGIRFEVDLPIYKEDKLIGIIDVKYLRYTKHARDKASWVVVAHRRLAASYPTIQRTAVVLHGHGWSKDAKKLIATSCIDVIELEPAKLDEILDDYGIKFVWHEKNAETPRESWKRFQELSNEEKKKIIEAIVEDVRERLEEWFRTRLIGDTDDVKLSLSFLCPEAKVMMSLTSFFEEH
ncbi:MAG: hypothetical protein DRJ69_05790 [Thermoprotei archaeon]|nr:MAG: hypothetical protein DRJ69_05790 [Thermoprotei archaeon]